MDEITIFRYSHPYISHYTELQIYFISISRTKPCNKIPHKGVELDFLTTDCKMTSLLVIREWIASNFIISKLITNTIINCKFFWKRIYHKLFQVYGFLSFLLYPSSRKYARCTYIQRTTLFKVKLIWYTLKIM